METLKHGLMTATQEEMSLLKQMVELVLMLLFQVLELNAKDLLKENHKVLLNIMVTHRHGSTIATQIETSLLKQTVVLELMHQLPSVSELNAKDSPKEDQEA